MSSYPLPSPTVNRFFGRSPSLSIAVVTNRYYTKEKTYYESAMTHSAKVSIKGQIVIPGELRKKFRLEPGTQVDVYEYGNVICLAPRLEDPINAAWGALPPEPSLAEALRRDRQRDESR